MNRSLRVLVVDDDRHMVRTLADILSAKGFQAEPAFSASEALSKAAAAAYDCALVDIRLPGFDGVELLKGLNEKAPGLPVVLMTAYTRDERVQEGIREGAVTVLTKPFDIRPLLDFLKQLRRQRSLVIVDDDERFCRTLADILGLHGFKTITVSDPHRAVGTIKEEAELVLLDMKLNGIDGLKVLQDIRRRFPDLPVILVTGYRLGKAEAIEAALSIGAVTCLTKPVEVTELIDLIDLVRRKQLRKSLMPDRA